MSIAVIIPVLDSNRYHELGDLAPFGDITLLEWKIIQLKEVFPAETIHISCQTENAKKLEGITQRHQIKLMPRPVGKGFVDAMLEVADQINAEDVLIAMTTTPFIGPHEYRAILKAYQERNSSHESVVTVKRLQEQCFYKGEPLNFTKNIARETLEPVYQMVNGCFVTPLQVMKSRNNHFGHNPLLFELEDLAAMELKQVYDLHMADQMIFSYFDQREHALGVHQKTETS